MSPSPYRTAADTRPPDEQTEFQTELLPFFAVLWSASFVRVAGAVVLYETFGSEPTLACLVLVALPLLVRDELGTILRRSVRRARFSRHLFGARATRVTRKP